jgi:hypothetical protein
MSTKRDPGRFDCYAKLGIDEPYFVIRAKDPVAGAVIREWVRLRSQTPGNERNPKLEEALVCADAMEAWRARTMSGQPCGCDAGADHLCDFHGKPEIQEMGKLIAAARAEVNEDLWGKLREVITFAAAVGDALGDISIEAAKTAIQRKVQEVFLGAMYVPTLRRVVDE